MNHKVDETVSSIHSACNMIWLSVKHHTVLLHKLILNFNSQKPKVMIAKTPQLLEIRKHFN